MPDAPKPNLLVSHLGNPGYMGLITETVGLRLYRFSLKYLALVRSYRLRYYLLWKVLRRRTLMKT